MLCVLSFWYVLLSLHSFSTNKLIQTDHVYDKIVSNMSQL